MTTETISKPARSRVFPTIPRLEAGDQLTQPEFRRRYEAMPDCEHAQLIEGVVHLGSRVSALGHGEPHADVATWLSNYRVGTPNTRAGINSTLWLDVDNAPQPDCYLRIEQQAGGQSRMDGGYIHGAPELIVEVSSSSVSYDLYDKLTAYRRNGVREYVVWRVRDAEVDWFMLRDGRFVASQSDDVGIYRSECFPGLWLDAAALIQGELAKVLDVAQSGIDSPAHNEFVSRLSK